MKIKREQVIERVDPGTHPGGTPLEKAPDRELGHELVPKERYTSAEFMQQEWDHIWSKVWLLGCREDQIPEPGDYVATDIGKESVLLLESLLARLREPAHLVCVLNRGRGSDFSLFEESKLGNRIEQRGGDVIELPALHADSMLAMDAHDKSFWAAVNNADPGAGPCLTVMERQRAKVFIRNAHASFWKILERIPDPPAL